MRTIRYDTIRSAGNERARTPRRNDMINKFDPFPRNDSRCCERERAGRSSRGKNYLSIYGRMCPLETYYRLALQSRGNQPRAVSFLNVGRFADEARNNLANYCGFSLPPSQATRAGTEESRLLGTTRNRGRDYSHRFLFRCGGILARAREMRETAGKDRRCKVQTRL